MKTIYPWLKNIHKLKNTVDELLTLEAEASPPAFLSEALYYNSVLKAKAEGRACVPVNVISQTCTVKIISQISSQDQLPR